MTIEEKFDINVMRAEIYKLYQLDWMSFRGHDPIELCEMISDRVAERIRDEVGDPCGGKIDRRQMVRKRNGRHHR